MVSQTITINNPMGLQLEPAGALCTEAVKYESKVSFAFADTIWNAKSVLSVLGACVKQGDQIELICEGTDEEEALAGICAVIEKGIAD